MKYIDYVEKETTRFYGPVNLIFGRCTTKDHLLKGIPIYKDTLFGIQPLGFHYCLKYYKNPTEFRPERWIDECDNLPSYAVGGFGGGARTCIGKYLAKL